ncbi:PQQ-binding-like beta-propeller repeat protein [bacterium]|nr:PQQ-binding-like beta-propeller repeat protein [bacterium]
MIFIRKTIFLLLCFAFVPFEGMGQGFIESEIKWEFQTDGNVTSPLVIGNDGTIYVGSGDDNLYAINPDGSKKWAIKTLTGVSSSPAIGSDGTIYFGSGQYLRDVDTILYAINRDGSKKWSFKIGGKDDPFTSILERILHPSPVVGRNGVIYIFSTDDNLYAINPDGSKKWSFKVDSAVLSSPAFKVGRAVLSSPAIGTDGTIYVGSYVGNLYAINPDGSKKWAFKVDSAVLSSPAIGNDGTIYVGSEDNNLYAINPDGSKKWVFKFGVVNSGGFNWHNGFWTIGNDGTVYVGSGDDNLYAINPDGSKKWAFSIKASALIVIDGIIYVRSGKNLIAIDSGGRRNWVVTENATSSPAIGNDGDILFVSEDKLFAIPALLRVTSHPKNTDTQIGGSITLSVVAESEFKLSYQWYKGDNVIEGATNPQFKLVNIKETDYSEYWVRISSDGITLEILKAKLMPPLPPIIITQPKSKKSNIGKPITFSVEVKSIIPMNYQWYKNGMAITDANTAKLSLKNVKKVDYAIYSVEIHNNSGKIVSENAVLLPSGWSTLGPEITNVPKILAVKLGDTAMISVTTLGLEPMNYQWYKDGVALTDASKSDLRIENFQRNDYGAYSVKIINDFGETIRKINEVIGFPIDPDLIFDTGSYEGSYKKLRIIENLNLLSPAVYGDIIYFPVNISIGDGEKRFDINTLENIVDRPVEEHGFLHARILRYDGGTGLDRGEFIDSIGNDIDSSYQWTVNIGNLATTSPAVDRAGNAYIGNKDGTIFCISKKGEIKWEYKTKGSVYSDPAIGSDGTIYVGSNDKELHAIYPDGRSRWRFNTEGYVLSSPSINGAGTIYFGSNDAKIYAIDLNGRKKWDFKTNGSVSSSPAIGNDGNIYVGSDDGKIYAIDLNGRKKWDFKTNDSVSSSPAIGNDGTIYVGSSDGSLYSINQNGRKKWKTKIKNANSSPAIGFGNILIVGNEVLSSSSGNVLHTFNISQDTIWKASKDLNSFDPQYYFSKETPKPLSGTATIINYDGEIIFSDNTFRFYCYKITGFGIDNSNWPMFGNNPSRDSNSNRLKRWVSIKENQKAENYIAGNKCELTVEYKGPQSELTYQWEKDGEIIDGETKKTLKLNPLVLTDAGIYIVTVSGPLGPEKSSPVKIIVHDSFVIGENSIKFTSFDKNEFFTISFESKSDSTYKIEASHDLRKWDEIGEVQGTGSSVEFTDWRKALFQKQYYRVKLVE